MARNDTPDNGTDTGQHGGRIWTADTIGSAPEGHVNPPARHRSGTEAQAGHLGGADPGATNPPAHSRHATEAQAGHIGPDVVEVRPTDHGPEPTVVRVKGEGDENPPAHPRHG